MSESVEIREAPVSMEVEPVRPATRLNWLAWSGLFFAFVQSVCSAFIALSSIRLLIGLAAFSSAVGLLKFADRIHISVIRVPMMAIALVGATVNLAGLWQLWRLRQRSASAWRLKAVPAKKRNSERLQLVLSLLTLALLVAEYFAHWKLKGSGL